MKHKGDFQTKKMCEFHADKFGVYTGCGFRVAYNNHMLFCPYCGKQICKFFMKIGGKLYVYQE